MSKRDRAAKAGIPPDGIVIALITKPKKFLGDLAAFSATPDR
jgi:hypothetical protein